MGRSCVFGVTELVNLQNMVLSCTSYDWNRYAAHPYELALKFEPQWTPIVGSRETFEIDFEILPWCDDRDGELLYGLEPMTTVFPTTQRRPAAVSNSAFSEL